MTAIDKKARDRIRRSFGARKPDYIYIISPGLRERVEVTVTPCKALQRGARSEHGLTAPAVIHYWREETHHGEYSQNFHTVEEFEEALHEH